MSRNRLNLMRLSAVVLASAVGGAFATAAQAGQSVTAPAAVIKSSVTVVPDMAQCGGKGMTGNILASSGSILCAHTAADTGAGSVELARTGPAAPLPIGPTTMAANPKCYGNGTSGKRVQAIYAFPQGAANRAGTVVPAIQNTYSKNMEGLVRSESASKGREIGIRFVMNTPCAGGTVIDVDTVMLPAYTATANGDQFGNIADELARRGYNRSDRKYVVWWDGNGAACGIGTLVPIDDEPSPANLHNGYPGQAFALALNMAQIYAPCWGAGSSGAEVELHEMYHTLGAVQFSAPYSNHLGHCYADPDVMCYSEGGVIDRVMCPGVSYKLLDCGKFNYFNSNPASSNYLFTHWNTANSRFLGEYPATDVLPVTPPSPYESP